MLPFCAKYNVGWSDFINTEENIKMLKNIENKIGTEYYPEKQNVLRFLNKNPNEIRCVIVGLDPYSSDFALNGKTTPVATGRSFELGNIQSWQEKFKQSSMQNILKSVYYNKTGYKKSLDAIRDEIKNGTFEIMPPKQWFDFLEKQGVLFLNASLTVVPGTVKTHLKLWEPFTTEVVKFIDKSSVCWMLWGNDAWDTFSHLIKNGTIIASCHPRLSNFVDENPFQYVKNIEWC